MLEDDPSHPDLDPALPEAGPDAPTVERPAGIESQFLLARAQARLLGDAAPERAPITVGRYRVTRRLGAGAMGLVYAARDDALDREVAIKLLQSQLAGSEASRQRLVREAQAMARLNHPNVAHVYEVGEHQQQLFIAMELVRGQTLRQWHREGVRDIGEVLAMHLQAARGLAAAHDVGLVHRDYKPDNVMVDEAGRARVMDFGLARASGESLASGEQPALGSPADSLPGLSHESPLVHDATLTGTVMGTPAYMAPEQLAGHRVDPRADQFAFCVALHEALHGHRPFSGTTSSALLRAILRRERRRDDRKVRGIPRAVQAMIDRGLAFAPEDRLPSMHAIAEVLQDALARARAGSRWLRAAIGTAVLGGGAAALLWSAQPGAPASSAEVPEAAAPVDPWAVVVADSQLPDPIATPLPDDPAHVTIHRLRNGLTIYVAPQAGVPMIQTAVVVRADPTDEGEGQAGTAEIVRDLLGETARMGTIDRAAEAPWLTQGYLALQAHGLAADDDARAALLALAQVALARARPYQVPAEGLMLLAGLGFGTLGQESPPGMVLTVEVPRNRLGPWAEVMAETLGSLEPRSFLRTVQNLVEGDRERTSDVLRVALDRGLGRATGRVLDAVAMTRNQRALPFAATREFFDAHYRPNNTAIVLVGDVSATEAVSVIESAFGAWAPAPVPARAPVVQQPVAPVDVVDDAPEQVTFAWPRADGVSPTAALEAMLMRSSLAERWLARDGRARWVWQAVPHHAFEIAVTPSEGHDLADAEAAVHAMLDAFASGAIDDESLAVAQAQAQLQSVAWSSSSYALSLLIAESFGRGLQWRDQLASMRGDPIARAAIQRDAASLRDAEAVIVRRHPGPARNEPVPPLLLPPSGPGAPGPSAFAKALLAQPASRLEPQFVLAGSDVLTLPWDGGRALAVDRDVPVMELSVALPYGLADDAWTCDAWRARVRALRPSFEREGAWIDVDCEVHETRLDITAVASRLDALLPWLVELRKPVLSDQDARTQLAAIARGRRELRHGGGWRPDAFAVAMLRGEHGVDAHMPEDAAVARARPESLHAALRASLAQPCELLVAGPDAADFARRIIAAGPPQPPGHVRAPVLPRARALRRTTVFLLDEPGRVRAEVRAGLLLEPHDTAARLRTHVLRLAIPEPEFETREPIYRFSMPHDASLASQRVFEVAGVDCANVDVPAALRALATSLQSPPSTQALAHAREMAEQARRHHRWVGLATAEYARSWGALEDAAGNIDPALAEWAALGTLDDASLLAQHTEFAAKPLVLTVVADLAHVDRAALAQLGDVVIVDDAVLRDVAVSDRRLFGYPPEAW
ncbi:MAG: protein kinase [Nannocystaceae bacterium]|nr:protein kinase [Nannocystaceae bacterium]